MYRSEAAFSRALVTSLKEHGVFVQRIETGSIGRGVPDLYCIFKGQELWIELKNKHCIWRPGQKAWALNYHRAKPDRYVLTLFSDVNGWIHFIPMIKPYVSVAKVKGIMNVYKEICG